jgi:hypothetical protein
VFGNACAVPSRFPQKRAPGAQQLRRVPHGAQKMRQLPLCEGLRRRGRCGLRQMDRETRTARSRFHADRSAVFGDDTVNDG